MGKKRLFLIDGNAVLYRSYYAIRGLTNSKGFPTNAIFGFLSTLKKLTDQENPDFLGLVFDTKGPTFRHRLFKDYKATRKPMPEDLVVQLPVLKDIIRGMNIPSFEHESYEADDLLGALACHAAAFHLITVLVSTDKDLLQLIDENTMMYNPAKEIYIGKKDVVDYFGVRSDQVADVLALWGDASDNIPGVPGVGEKTAKSLITEFGSLDAILKHPERINNPRLQTKIAENLEILKLSRQLVAIACDAPVEFDLESLRRGSPDNDILIPLLKEMEFSGFLSEATKTKTTDKTEYRAILDASSLQALADRIRKTGFVALDTETDNRSPTRARLVGMSFCLEPGEAYYLPIGHDYDGAPDQVPFQTVRSILSEILESPAIRKHGQNIKYDAIVLRNAGFDLQGIDLDSMILSYLVEPNQGKHGLGRLAAAHLGLPTIQYSDVVGRGKNEVTMNAVPIDAVTPYACQDADFALRLVGHLWPEVERQKLEPVYRELEQPLIPVLADMEQWGMKVDGEKLRNLSEELQEEMSRLQIKIFEISGEEFNLNSPQQLARILFEKLRLPPSRKTKVTREYSTGLAVLQGLAPRHPLAKQMLEYRQLAKLKSGYADALPQLIHPRTGRIHTSYNQTVAATGRLSSSDPNLQNIPARGEMGIRFREAFIPEAGRLFLSADYAQIELRVLAHLSEDPRLIGAFKSDRDIHSETADHVFGQMIGLPEGEARRRAKIINFSIIYGASAYSLAGELGTSTSEAQAFIDLYYEQFPRVRSFLDGTVDEARERGFSTTLFGRTRPIPELRQKNKTVQQAGRRIALNTPIQGTAADLIKKAMIDIWREMKKKGLQSTMVLQVHDELVFEVPDNEQVIMEELVRDRMENVHPLHVPLQVHLGWGVNWAEAK
ncbi:MAG: DNA polymerase I [Acidobacteriota bacterium]